MNHKEFIQAFDPNFVLIKDVDDFDRFEYLCRLSSVKIPDNSLFESFFNFIRDEDNCTVTVNIGDGESTTFHKQASYDSTIAALQSKSDIYEDGEQLDIKIIIDKSNQNGNFFFYSEDGFNNYIKTCNAVTLSQIFSLDKFAIQPQIRLIVSGFKGTLESSRIVISSDENISPNQIINDFALREKRIDSIKSNTHSAFLSSLKVLPEDFVFEGDGKLNSEIKLLFSQLSLFLSVSAIFDITNLTSSEYYFKLNGYKSISGTIELNSFSLGNTTDYFKVYDWIYRSGSITDKIGLARNIISLHLKKNSSLELDGNVFESLMSSYKIYEKQNIKQYIEVRNKMSDQIIDYSKKATTIAENFASGFQKSSLTIVTFFSSIVVMRVLGNPSNTIDFAIYSTWITAVFLFASILYMWVSRIELKQQKKRFEKSYSDFKKRYTDLLTEEDIERILNSDQEHKADLAFIDNKLKWYSALWWSVIGMISITIVGYYLYVNSMSTLTESMTNFPDI